jgi:signal transduction histidine kinase
MFDKIKELTLLYAEDEPIVRQTFSDILSGKVKELYVASDGAEALELYNKHSPDILITDIKMPRMDGIELVKEIRNQNKEIPIIITSAHSETEFFLDLIDLGVDQYIIKPINGKRFFEALNKAAQLLIYKKELILKNRELEELNHNLELRVQEEVAKNFEKEQMLAQKSKLADMGEMIGNIAHQWRQPLSELSGVLINVQDSFYFEDLDQDYLENQIDRANDILEFMSDTIENFRNFFSINKENEVFSVEKACENAVSLMEGALKSYNIKLIKEYETDLDFVGHKNEFSQVVLNLLCNAKDVLLEREVEKPSIKLSIKKDGEKTHISIRDNGGGIELEEVNKIFDPYFTTKDDGTGIGLYMSKIIIEKSMNGKIFVKNLIDGAEFVILL